MAQEQTVGITREFFEVPLLVELFHVVVEAVQDDGSEGEGKGDVRKKDSTPALGLRYPGWRSQGSRGTNHGHGERISAQSCTF